MTIGLHTLELAKVLVIEKRLEADRPRRWRTATRAGISARGTPERDDSCLECVSEGRQPRRGVVTRERCV